MSKEYESERLISHPEGSSLPDALPADTTERRTRQRNIVLIAILTLSIIINLLQATVRASIPWHTSHAKQFEYRSQFAGLRDNEVSVEWVQNSVYTSPNVTERDLHLDAINHDSGIVAVPKVWALEQGLPLGSTFPWGTDKTIYFVNAYHALHCVKNIYKSFMEYRMGIEQSLSHHHIIHCLDQIQTDILCTADDTLRVTFPDRPGTAAQGQIRQCRSWDALEAWTMAHPGCFRYGNPNVEDEKTSQIPRMRYCQEGNPDLELIREYFSKGSDWRPADEKVWSWFDNSTASNAEV
ncbi:hypothetical protein EAF04_000664 [Stromatinia cepivora]|nr:hypothetical protein EAF04_000664 [Stromatinia cepivora]